METGETGTKKDKRKSRETVVRTRKNAVIFESIGPGSERSGEGEMLDFFLICQPNIFKKTESLES